MKSGFWFWPCALVAVVALVIAFLPRGKSGSEVEKTGGVAALASICAKSYSDIPPMLTAIRNSDLVAMVGLVERGKAVKISQGTQLTIFRTEDGVSTVHVDSGPQIGETCHFPSNFIE